MSDWLINLEGTAEGRILALSLAPSLAVAARVRAAVVPLALR